MKTNKAKLSAVLIALGSVFSASAMAADDCELIKQDQVSAEQLFVDIDFDATIAKLPASLQSEAQQHLATIDQLNLAWEQAAAADVDLEVEDEVRYEVVQRRLFSLFDDNEVELVEKDLLQNLNSDERAQINSLVKELFDAQCDKNIDEAKMELKAQRLEELLAKHNIN